MSQETLVGVRAVREALEGCAFSARAALRQAQRMAGVGEDWRVLLARLEAVDRLAMSLMHALLGGGALSVQLKAA